MIPDDVRKWADRWGFGTYGHDIFYIGPIVIYEFIGTPSQYRATVPLFSEGYSPPEDWYRVLAPYNYEIQFDDNHWDVFRGTVAAADLAVKALKEKHPILNYCVYGTISAGLGDVVCEGLNATIAVMHDGTVTVGRRFNSEEEALASLPQGEVRVYSPLRPERVAQPDRLDYYVFRIVDRANKRLIPVYSGLGRDEVEEARRRRDSIVSQLCGGSVSADNWGMWC